MRATAFSLLPLVLLALASAAGCGGKPAAETVQSPEATESSPSPEEVLAGNWVGAVLVDDDVVSRKLEEVKDADVRTKNRVYWAIETPASLKSKLNLKPDGSMTMAATVSTAEGDKTINGEGTWEVISADGFQATVRLNYDGQVEEKVFTFDDADSFATDPPGVDKTIGTLKFKRLR